MSALAKRKAKDALAVDRRILILDPEKCKPNSAAYAFLKQYAGKCGKTCIEVQGKLVRISEDLCAACLTRAKHCPGGAVSIVKLPTNLETDMTHGDSVDSIVSFESRLQPSYYLHPDLAD